MSGKRLSTPFDQITFEIIGRAMKVHRELGPGYRENTYQRAMETELTRAGLAFEPEEWLEVHHEGILVGYYIPDFQIEDKVIVEIKALRGLDDSHLAQVIGYLAVTGYAVGLLINFGRYSLQWRRILPPQDITKHRVNRQWLFVPDWLREQLAGPNQSGGIDRLAG